MELTTIHKVFRYHLKPTLEQLKALERQAGFRRFVWNWGLEQRNLFFKEHSKSLSYVATSVKLTELKKQLGMEWLKEADSQMLQQSLMDLDKAFKKFFKEKKGFPQFKSKHRDQLRFRLPQRVKVLNSSITIPKVGVVKADIHRPVGGEIKSVTFKRDSTNQWFATVLCEIQTFLPLQPLVKPETTVGLDLGLKFFFTPSKGEPVQAPKFFRRSQRRLRKAQKELSRRKKGSKRREKSKLKVAKIHKQIANQRQDFLHKQSTALVQKFDLIGFEDLNLTALTRTKLRGHSKSWNDLGAGEFIRMLEYKTAWAGKHSQTIDRFFPSSKLHAACGTVNKELKLEHRTWVCACGEILDRDKNAALNIELEVLRIVGVLGQPQTLNARGGDVRLGFRLEQSPAIREETTGL